jgi:hypothetical protein
MSIQDNIILVISEITVFQPAIAPPVKIFQKKEIRKPMSMFSIIYNK